MLFLLFATRLFKHNNRRFINLLLFAFIAKLPIRTNLKQSPLNDVAIKAVNGY